MDAVISVVGRYVSIETMKTAARKPKVETVRVQIPAVSSTYETRDQEFEDATATRVQIGRRRVTFADHLNPLPADAALTLARLILERRSGGSAYLW